MVSPAPICQVEPTEIQRTLMHRHGTAYAEVPTRPVLLDQTSLIGTVPRIQVHVHWATGIFWLMLDMNRARAAK